MRIGGLPSKVATRSTFVAWSRPIPSSAVPASTAAQRVFTGIGPVWQVPGLGETDHCSPRLHNGCRVVPAWKAETVWTMTWISPGGRCWLLSASDRGDRGLPMAARGLTRQ